MGWRSRKRKRNRTETVGMRPEQQVANTTAIGRRQERVTNRHCSRVVFIVMFISQPTLNRHCSRVVFIVMFISQPTLNITRSLVASWWPPCHCCIGTHISKNDQKMISSRRGTANNPHRQQRDLQQLHYT